MYGGSGRPGYSAGYVDRPGALEQHGGRHFRHPSGVPHHSERRAVVWPQAGCAGNFQQQPRHGHCQHQVHRHHAEQPLVGGGVGDCRGGQGSNPDREQQSVAVLHQGNGGGLDDHTKEHQL